MRFGLSNDTLQAIHIVFVQHTAIERVVLYGSRALGTYHPGSDIDLAVAGGQLTFRRLLDLMIDLDELDFLYRFDVLNLNTVTNADLLDHIQRVGIVIYQAPEVVPA